MKKYYTVYKIINLINSKIYIGVHETYNLDDGYMGSGKYLINAQNKYGMDNFKKEFIVIFDNPYDMFLMESDLVNEEFVSNKNTYNITLGGNGGFHHLNTDKKLMTKRNKKAGLYGYKATIQNNPLHIKEMSLKGKKVLKEKYPDGVKTNFKNNKALQEKANKLSQTKEAIEKKKKTLRKINHAVGKNNSQYNTCWIMNIDEQKNKKIPNDELEQWFKLGWIKGRKLTFKK